MCLGGSFDRSCPDTSSVVAFETLAPSDPSMCTETFSTGWLFLVSIPRGSRDLIGSPRPAHENESATVGPVLAAPVRATSQSMILLNPIREVMGAPGGCRRRQEKHGGSSSKRVCEKARQCLVVIRLRAVTAGAIVRRPQEFTVV